MAAGLHAVDLVSNAVPRDRGESVNRGFTGEVLLLQERLIIGLAEVIARYPKA